MQLAVPGTLGLVATAVGGASRGRTKVEAGGETAPKLSGGSPKVLGGSPKGKWFYGVSCWQRVVGVSLSGTWN